MLRRLYDWTMSLASHRHADWALGGVSFIESSVFPIPPDTLMIPMVIAQRQRWIKIALICTITSVLGALLGYYIGAALFDTIGKPVLEFYGKADAFEKIRVWYNEWGGWGVFFAAITPFPFKVVTIFSGWTSLNLGVFIISSIIGRAFRFFIVSALLYRFGEPIRTFIEKRLGLVFTIACVLLIGGFALIKLVV